MTVGDRPRCVTRWRATSAHRRSGVGSALITDVEAHAIAQGARHIDLSSGDWRDDAHAFYERLGFENFARTYAKRLGATRP